MHELILIIACYSLAFGWTVSGLARLVKAAKK